MTSQDRNIDQLYAEQLGRDIIQAAFDKLEQDLPGHYYYHSIKHTRDVLKEVLTLALEDNLSAEEIDLLSIGAAYHDTGFIEKPVDNEWVAVRFAREAMERYGEYAESQKLCVENMILDTQLVETALGATQLPTDKLAKYLLDADLGNLGRDDFFEKSELLRQEIGVERKLFYPEACRLLRSHQWLTPAAKTLREEKQKGNLEKLEQYLLTLETDAQSENEAGLSLTQLLFLAKLPLLLNSSLDFNHVATTALGHLKSMTGAEAATLFLLDASEKELSFWATQGGDAERLKDKKMPSDKGIVGWVIQNQEPILHDQVKRDERFYSAIDDKGSFDTTELICVPLTARGEKKLGAIQVLNKKGPESFSEDELYFVTQFAHQLALALENARLYEDSQKMKRMLEILDERKNEMITVLTHEFRTPVNVIQNSAELLAMGIPNEETSNKISQTLQKGVNRFISIVDQLQSLSRMQAESVGIEREVIELTPVLDALLARFENAFDQRNQTFTLHRDEIAKEVYADSGLLLIALGNLLSNAIRFTEDGGEIELRVAEQGDRVLFEVKDTGIGIDPDQQSLIFEKFYEVKDAMQHSSGEYEFCSGGLGIGLATVKSILEAHDTRISVESALGQGSTFSFKLQKSTHN